MNTNKYKYLGMCCSQLYVFFERQLCHGSRSLLVIRSALMSIIFYDLFNIDGFNLNLIHKCSNFRKTYYKLQIKLTNTNRVYTNSKRIKTMCVNLGSVPGSVYFTRKNTNKNLNSANRHNRE